VTQNDDPKDDPKDEEQSRAKKERVLHTRVPAVLEEELKRLATSLRMPVSNVVRAILEDAVEAVEAASEKAEGELKGIAHRIQSQRESLRRAVQGEEVRGAVQPAEAPSCPEAAEAIEGVLGFQRLTLATQAACTVCGKSLPRGSAACRGIREDGGPKVLVGGRCRLVPEGE
jgi:hypothetical protein